MTGAINNILLSLSNNIDRASRFVMIFIMSVMVITILGQVFFRYVLNSALPWPEELTIFLMSWMTFVGSGIALKAWQHIGITLFANMLPINFQVILSIIVKIAVLFFALFLTYTGMILVLKSTNIVSEAMRISMIWPRLSLPVGGVIMVIHTVSLLYQEVYTIFRKN